MSSAMQQSLGPSSSSMERDARRIHDDTSVSAGNIAIGVVIGRAAEFFDFFVYGIASVVVFPQLFFPFAPDRLTATLLLLRHFFRLPSGARPLGSLVFMAIDRTYGRGVKLTIALFLSAARRHRSPSCRLCDTRRLGPSRCLPSFRLGQGFALGGAWRARLASRSERAPRPSRLVRDDSAAGRAPWLHARQRPLRLFLVSISEADFLAWGWALPVLVAFAIKCRPRCSRACGSSDEGIRNVCSTCTSSGARVTEVLRANEQRPHRRLRPPCKLRSLPSGDRISAQLGWNLHGSRRSSFLMVQFSARLRHPRIVASGLIADRIAGAITSELVRS